MIYRAFAIDFAKAFLLPKHIQAITIFRIFERRKTINMQKNLLHPQQRKVFIEGVKKLLDTASRSKNPKGFWVSIKRVYEKRSNSQNAYLHLMFGWVSASLGWSMEQVKQYYKEVNRDIFYIECPNTGLGIWRSTADLSTAEMEACNAKFRTNMSKNAGIYIALPNEPDYERWKVEAQSDIKAARQFMD